MENSPGIYLMIDFSWPENIEKTQAQMAYRLHELTQSQSWIREVVAASGGIGPGPTSTWIFWLENYAALDKLLKDSENEVSQAYTQFFEAMPIVSEKIREEVLFL